ncbi:hypothetical protein [Streptomyces sp. NBC_01478]|uniref:hypothetical protein n=1 Tax=Streptomyces sp. NBC_01478 TaxID=2903882 RepID=UPI003FCD5A7F
MTDFAAARPVTPSPDRAYRILLVEDDEADAVLVDELLHDTGPRFAPSTRTTLAGARSELASREIDCILLDLHLPTRPVQPLLLGRPSHRFDDVSHELRGRWSCTGAANHGVGA